MSIQVTVFVQKEENWYVAKCIENSVASQGETIEESLIHLKEALELYYEDSAFVEEILADLIQQGYSGDALLTEFKNISRKVRPAVEKLIEEADKIAEAASTNHIDITDELLDDEESELD